MDPFFIINMLYPQSPISPLAGRYLAYLCDNTTAGCEPDFTFVRLVILGGQRRDTRSTCGRHGALPLLIPQRTGCLLLLWLSSLFSPGVAHQRFTFNPSNASRCPGLHQPQLSPISLNTWCLLVAHQNHRNTPESVCVCIKTCKDEKKMNPSLYKAFTHQVCKC